MKRKHIIPKASPGESFYGNERGIILIIVIAFVAIIALVSTVAVITINTDIKISSNYRSSKTSFYNTKAGIEEAKARLRGAPPGSTGNVNQMYAGDEGSIDDDWCAYILTDISDDPDVGGGVDDDGFDIDYPISGDPDNTTLGTNTVQLTTPPDMSYWVRIRHKREYDAEQAGHENVAGKKHYQDKDGDTSAHPDPPPTNADRGNVIYYGFIDEAPYDGTPTQFTTSTATKYKPVEIIESYGDRAGSTNTIKEEVVVNPGLPMLGAIYSKTTVGFKGVATTVDGNDGCTGDVLPSIYNLTDPPADYKGGSSPLKNPAEVGTVDITIQDYINILKRGEIAVTDKDGNNITYWGAADDFQTFYADTVWAPGAGQLSLDGNDSGSGILLVEGDLVLSGTFNWDGIIVATGTIDCQGGGKGGINIEGTVIGSSVENSKGNVDFQYNSCYVYDSLYAGAINEILWQEVY